MQLENHLLSLQGPPWSSVQVETFQVWALEGVPQQGAGLQAEEIVQASAST